MHTYVASHVKHLQSQNIFKTHASYATEYTSSSSLANNFWKFIDHVGIL